MKKVLAIILCLALVITLAACGKNTESMPDNEQSPTKQETTATTAVNEEQTEITTATSPKEIGKITDPEDGTVLDVDLSIRGEIKDNAPSLNSGDFILEGKTMQLPLAGSALTDEGWHFSENGTAKDTKLKPNTTTNLVSFHIYDADGNEMLLYQAVNDSDSEKSALECQISSFGVDTFSLNESFGDLVLPGGICLFSKAADVIEVFGTPENATNFERVEVFEHSIRYVEHNESGLCYTFSFYSSEDYNGELKSHIRMIKISTDY